jgi:hypothetical protein
MPTRILAYVDRAYLYLLRLYPAAFRERFAAEILQVFRSLCRQAYTESGIRAVLALWLAATWDGLQAAGYQWYLHIRKQRTGNMNANLEIRRDGIQPLSPLQTGAAVLPFLIFGMVSMLSKTWVIPTQPEITNISLNLFVNPYQVFYWIVLTGLAVGLLSGFPRWAYAYLGWSLIFIVWWSGFTIYGYSIGNLPLLGVFVFTLLIRRSWLPLRSMLVGLWRDWTLLSLAIYVLYGFVFMLYDSNHHPFLLAFMAFTTLAISLGAFGYFHAVSPLRRVLALSAGLLVAAVLSGISEATWDFAGYYGLPGSTAGFNFFALAFSAGLALVMLGNGFLARWRLSRRTV